MCGRYTRHYTWEEVRDFLDLRFPDVTGLRAAYNVAPTRRAPIVRLSEHGRALEMAVWGLVPHWASDPSIGSRLINARAETIAEKPSFREAFKRRRCVVPVSGFYEWARTGRREPHHITRADGAIMCLAGLWERWSKGDQPLETFTIVTTEANAQIAGIHPRMPVVIEPEDVAAWLDEGGTPEARLDLLRPAADGVLVMHEVSRRVGSVANDDASLIEPVQKDPTSVRGREV